MAGIVGNYRLSLMSGGKYKNSSEAQGTLHPRQLVHQKTLMSINADSKFHMCMHMFVSACTCMHVCEVYCRIVYSNKVEAL